MSPWLIMLLLPWFERWTCWVAGQFTGFKIFDGYGGVHLTKSIAPGHVMHENYAAAFTGSLFEGIVNFGSHLGGWPALSAWASARDDLCFVCRWHAMAPCLLRYIISYTSTNTRVMAARPYCCTGIHDVYTACISLSPVRCMATKAKVPTANATLARTPNASPPLAPSALRTILEASKAIAEPIPAQKVSSRPPLRIPDVIIRLLYPMEYVIARQASP